MDKQVLFELMKEWRHDLHKIPEEALKEYKTSAYIVEQLKDMGLEVFEGIGGTGIVAKMVCGQSDRTVGLRADFDALPCEETNNLPYKSEHDGWMHGCGHDGHTAMLLGAAKLLLDEQDFDGTIYFIFQPGEEPGTGARAMVDDGLFERFPMQAVYGMHNETQFPFGTFRTKAGPVKTSEDDFVIRIHGKGGHASAPHLARDPMVIAAEIIMTMQTVVSRMTSPLESTVVSFTDIKTDGYINTIPGEVEMIGDARAFKAEHQDMIENTLRKVIDYTCDLYGATGELEYNRTFMPTINDAECAAIAAKAAANVLGENNVNGNCSADTSSEDFSVLASQVPGCYCFLGTCEEGRPETQYPLHNRLYDFNDDILLAGAEVYAEMARVSLKEKK